MRFKLRLGTYGHDAVVIFAYTTIAGIGLAAGFAAIIALVDWMAYAH